MITGSRGAAHDPTRRTRRLVMLVDGVVLAVIGAAQVTR